MTNGEAISLLLIRWTFLVLFIFGYHNSWPDVWLVGFMACWAVFACCGLILTKFGK